MTISVHTLALGLALFGSIFLAADERDALFTAVGRRLCDRTARLVLADWLEERGDTQHEYLRLWLEQTDPARTPSTQRTSQILSRTAMLLREHGREWVPYPVVPKEIDYGFQGGVIGTIWVSTRFFLAHREEIFERIPTLQEVLPFGVVPEAQSQGVGDRLDITRFANQTGLWSTIREQASRGVSGAINCMWTSDRAYLPLLMEGLSVYPIDSLIFSQRAGILQIAERWEEDWLERGRRPSWTSAVLKRVAEIAFHAHRRLELVGESLRWRSRQGLVSPEVLHFHTGGADPEEERSSTASARCGSLLKRAVRWLTGR